MPNDLGNHLERHALGSEQRNAGVTGIVKTLFWQSVSLHKRIEFFQDFAVSDRRTNGAGEDMTGFLPPRTRERPLLGLAIEMRAYRGFIGPTDEGASCAVRS